MWTECFLSTQEKLEASGNHNHGHNKTKKGKKIDNRFDIFFFLVLKLLKQAKKA